MLKNSSKKTPQTGRREASLRATRTHQQPDAVFAPTPRHVRAWGRVGEQRAPTKEPSASVRPWRGGIVSPRRRPQLLLYWGTSATCSWSAGLLICWRRACGAVLTCGVRLRRDDGALRGDVDDLAISFLGGVL